MSLAHTLGFELADVGPGAIEVQRQRRRADGRGSCGSRSRDGLGDWTGETSVISIIPVVSRRDSSLAFSGIADPDLPLANPVANG